MWLAESELVDVCTQGRSKKDAIAMLADAFETLIDDPKVGISVAEADDEGGVTIESNKPAALAAFVLQRLRLRSGRSLSGGRPDLLEQRRGPRIELGRRGGVRWKRASSRSISAAPMRSSAAWTRRAQKSWSASAAKPSASSPHTSAWTRWRRRLARGRGGIHEQEGIGAAPPEIHRLDAPAGVDDVPGVDEVYRDLSS